MQLIERDPVISVALHRLPHAGARITGIGAHRPTGCVAALDLVGPFSKDAAWLLERTGIEELRRLGLHESLFDLAVSAGRAALADAGCDRADLVIVASCSQTAGPQDALAQRVAAVISPGAFGIDLNAACSGFVFAIASAADLVHNGTADSVLVIGAEQMSRLIDPSDIGTSILFADGAGAVLVSHCDSADDAFAHAAYFSDGGIAREVLTIPDGSTMLAMDGQAVFRWAVSTVPDVIDRALQRAGVAASEIEVFLPHQANARITEAVRRKVGLDNAIVADDIRCSGNTSAASIPLALAALRDRAELSGKLALVAGFGAGLMCAAQVLRLP